MDLVRPLLRTSAVALAGAIALAMVACSPQGSDGSADVPDPPAKGLATVTAQKVLEFQPAGVTPAGSVDEPADGVVRFNASTRTFSAPTEAAAATAASELRTQALADRWTGSDFEDPGGTGGVPTATLTKGSLVLEISYTTATYQQNWLNDDDGFEVRMAVTDEPTTDQVPAS